MTKLYFSEAIGTASRFLGHTVSRLMEISKNGVGLCRSADGGLVEPSTQSIVCSRPGSGRHREFRRGLSRAIEAEGTRLPFYETGAAAEGLAGALVFTRMRPRPED